jgi:hypothetical protein
MLKEKQDGGEDFENSSPTVLPYSFSGALIGDKN